MIKIGEEETPPKDPPAAEKPLPPTEPEEDTDEDEEKTVSMIDKANLAALRQEEANKKHEALLNRQERMNVEKTLGGTTEAGTPSEKKEQTPKEYAEQVMRGEIEPAKE